MTTTLPLKTTIGGRTWYLYTYEYQTDAGIFCGYLHATGDEHAEQMMQHLRSTAVLKGRMVSANEMEAL